MTTTQWMHGCKVDISDWYDGIHDHLNIAAYKPGAHLDSPERECGFLIPRSERGTFLDYLDSVVSALLSEPKFWDRSLDGKLITLSLDPPKIHL